MDLSRLFHPASIAVVGASERFGSYGGQTILNAALIGFPGPVWGINPRRREVHGRPCLATLDDLPGAVDAVVVAVPAAVAAEVVERAGALGCGGAVVIGAGFAEVASGRVHQERLIAAAGRHDLPVCGPNGNGIVSMSARAALWGDALAPREPGHVALVSQSGNVAVNALATARGLRLHTVVSCGNQAVLSAADYLDFLCREAQVRSIGLYLEDDGDGARLCDSLAACAERRVPVVVLKVGASAAGAHAATAHTGAVAGDQRMFRALVQEAGAVWAQDVHELLEMAKTLAVCPRVRPAGGLAILTCSGGDSSQGADEAYRLGLSLPSLAPGTVASLGQRLPPAATIANPLDYTSMIWGDVAALGGLIQTVGEDRDVDQVLVFYDQPGGLQGDSERSWAAVRDGIRVGAAASPVPTMVCSTLPELLDDAAAWQFAASGVAAAAGLRTGLACAAAMRRAPGDPARLRAIAAAARASRVPASGGEWLAEHDAKALLRRHAIAVVDGGVVGDEAGAVAALGALGGSVAVKLSAQAVQHKSELDAVELHLRTVTQVRAAYRRIAALADRMGGEVLVERMAAPGIEVLVAARRVGVVPALVVGLGGVWTELLDDVAVIVLPAGARRVTQGLRSLRGASLLTGGRGRVPLALDELARLAAGVGGVLLTERLELIELNPVIVDQSGAVVADAVIRRPTPLVGEVGEVGDVAPAAVKLAP